MSIPNLDAMPQTLTEPPPMVWMGKSADSTLARNLNQNLNQSTHPFETYQDEYLYAMNPDWDGEGAIPVNDNVIALAEGLFNKYAGQESLLGITPGKDGSLSFLWDDHSGNYVYLDIGPNQTIHLYFDVIDGSHWEGVSVADDPEIHKYLRKAFKFLCQSIVKNFETITISGNTGQTILVNIPV